MIELVSYFTKQPQMQVRNYTYPNVKTYHFSVIDINTGIRGFGGDHCSSVAQTKALFELIERTVYHKYSDERDQSSSGWAAHTNLEQAILNSKFEIIERDAILTSWLSKKSPVVLNEEFFPLFHKTFPVLQFGIGHDFVVLGVLLKNESNQSRMFISVCEKDRRAAVEKLKIDSERAFHLLSEPEPIDNPILKLHHDSFCKASDAEINWLFCNGSGLMYKSFLFSQRLFEVPLWNKTTAFVSCVKSENLQELFYGKQYYKHILRKRLRSVLNRPYRINRLLHPFL